MDSMSLDEQINAYFVTVPSSGSGSPKFAKKEDFSTAQTLLRSHIPEKSIRHIKASEGFTLIASGQLTKRDVFIFNRFEGDFFEQLQLTKSLLIGPRCLSTCLLRCEPIPLGTSPVYTTAMRNMQISATGVTSKEKERLRHLIQWMGGHYFADFGRTITHLISNTVKSSKYEQAKLHGIPVMHMDWVQRVWDRSCVDDVCATDDEFSKYNLPIFFGTNITSSGLTNDKKNEIARIINENGGTYHASFRSQLVDIVVTEKSKTLSDKYKAAVRFKKDIVTPEWIIDSQQKGFALPMKAYYVKSLNASTPTKCDQSLADFTAADNTQLTEISQISVERTRSNLMSTVNESISSTLSTGPSTSKQLQRELLKKGALNAHYRLVLDELDPKLAKKAGTFLDGCCIYLSGFRSEEREKLNRILNLGGATRYDVVNEKITHIIVGDMNDADFRAWKKNNILTGAHIVRLNWLLESIRLKQPASEIVYRMSLPDANEPDAPSPSSKRTLHSMNHSFKQPELPIRKKLFDAAAEGDKDSPAPLAGKTEQPPAHAQLLLDEDEHNLLAQYSQEHLAPAAPPTPLPPPRPRLTRSTATAASSNESHLQAPPIASSTQISAPDTTGNQTAEQEITIDYENLNFMEGSTVYVYEAHFEEELYQRIVYECEAAKGDLVADTFRDQVDYAIVSFERTLDTSKLPIKTRHIVNDIYLETCLTQNAFKPIDYYHRHVPHTADSQPLAGLTVVVSTYAGLERNFINTLAELMGAHVNKRYLKKERPLLVCPHPEGSKYEGAIKWCYPIVTADWLLQCAARGMKLPFHTHLVGASVSEFPRSPALKERNETLSHVAVAAEPPPMADVGDISFTMSENKTVTPADFTPLRNKRITELAGTSRRSLGTPINSNSNSNSQNSSPRTPTNKHLVGPSYDLEIMEEMLADIQDDNQRNYMRDIINEIRQNPTPQLERIRRQAVTPNNRGGGGRWPSPKGVPEFCTTPAFKRRMEEAFERRFRLPMKAMKPDTPIEVICRRVIYATARAQGIAVSDDEDDQEGGGAEQQQQQKEKLVKTATVTPLQQNKISPGASRVLPRSIFAQHEEEQRQLYSPLQHRTLTPKGSASRPSHAAAAYVPCTQSPNASSEELLTAREVFGQPVVVHLGQSATLDFDQINFTDTEPLTNDSQRASTSGTGKLKNMSTLVASPGGVVDLPEVKQITDYLKSFETRRQSLKRSSGGSGDEPPSQQARPDNADTESHFVQAFESEQFGCTDQMVGWQDPAEFTLERRSKCAASHMQHKGTVRVSISCTSEDTREEIIAKVLQLGGEVCENLVNYDASCTHFLCERPNRGEKILGCISSGKWVLGLRYVEECFAKGHFVDEELFEWGNCRALNMPVLKPDEQLIAQAAHRWRRELNVSQTGAFTDFRVILRLADRHLDALKTVILAGGGTIVDAQSPYSRRQQAHLATHCFVDMKRNRLVREDYDFLRANNVKILTQMYINEYLMNGRDADYTQYEVQL